MSGPISQRAALYPTFDNVLIALPLPRFESNECHARTDKFP